MLLFVSAVMACFVLALLVSRCIFRRSQLPPGLVHGLVIVCSMALFVALVLTLLVVNGSYRTLLLKQFVHDAIACLNDGQLPRMSPYATHEDLAQIETLRGAGIPTDCRIAVLDFFGWTYFVELHCKTGDVYACRVSDLALSFFGRPKLALRELRILKREHQIPGPSGNPLSGGILNSAWGIRGQTTNFECPGHPS